MCIGAVSSRIAAACILGNINVAGFAEACAEDQKDRCEYKVEGPAHPLLHFFPSLRACATISNRRASLNGCQSILSPLDHQLTPIVGTLLRPSQPAFVG